MEANAQSKSKTRPTRIWNDISLKGQVFCADYRFPGGIVRSSIVKIDETNYLVYSPGKGLSESARSLIPENTQVHILAPNSFHNIGIEEWINCFPSAKVYAGRSAMGRLAKKVDVEIIDADQLNKISGDHLQILALPKNRSGETWVRIPMADKTYFLTCDAFFSFERIAKKGFLKWVMKINRMGPGLEISRIYEHVVLKDKATFVSWVKEVLSKESKIVLVPCHGMILDGESLVSELIGLVDKRLG